MADYRVIRTSFWGDPLIAELPPDEKLLYLFFMTNKDSSQCGIYEITKRTIAYYTGLSMDKVSHAIQGLIKNKRIKYNDANNEVFVIRWLKHNWIDSPKVLKRIEKDLQIIKTREYVQELCAMYEGLRAINVDTAYEYEGEGEEYPPAEPDGPQEPQEPCPYDDIVELYNNICQSFPKVLQLTDKRRKKLSTLWRKHPDIDWFADVFAKAEGVPFLRGKNKTQWKASYDWLWEGDHCQRILEGNYTTDPGVSALSDKLKVPQHSNFQQRKYSDAFFESLYVKPEENT